MLMNELHDFGTINRDDEAFRRFIGKAERCPSPEDWAASCARFGGERQVVRWRLYARRLMLRRLWREFRSLMN